MRLGGVSVSVTDPDPTNCKHKAELIKAEHRNGKRATKRVSLTLGEAIDTYIARRTNVLSPSTVRGYKEIQRNRFKAYHNKTINSINWQKAINDEARIVSPKTLKNAWALVRSVLMENGLDISVRLPAVPSADKAWLTPEQIPVFMEAIKGQPCEIPALLALSSLRKSELLGLDWDNVDLERKVIHVRGAAVRGPNESFVHKKQNKTGASVRDVPLIPQLYDALVAVENKTGPVITCHYQTPYKQIRAVCERLEIPNVGLHGLRHSFASLCYHLGMSELETMSIGGWSDYQTMRKIYTHLSENDRVNGADKFTDFFKNANKNANAEQETQ